MEVSLGPVVVLWLLRCMRLLCICDDILKVANVGLCLVNLFSEVILALLLLQLLLVAFALFFDSSLDLFSMFGWVKNDFIFIHMLTFVDGEMCKFHCVTVL